MISVITHQPFDPSKFAVVTQVGVFLGVRHDFYLKGRGQASPKLLETPIDAQMV